MAKTLTRKQKATRPPTPAKARTQGRAASPRTSKPKKGKRPGKSAAKPARVGKARSIVEVKKAVPAAAKARQAAPVLSPQDEAVLKAFKRIKPLLQQPLDSRVSHLVEVFGTDVVASLIAAARKSGLVGENEIAEAITRGEAAMGPAPHGSWAWHELMTSDATAARKFYAAMFGWQANEIEMMPGFNYTMFRRAEREVAGLMEIGPEHGDLPSGWGVYIAVDDVDAAAEKAESLGGEVIVPAHDIPVGRWAMIKDPCGATLCLYRSRTYPIPSVS